MSSAVWEAIGYLVCGFVVGAVLGSKHPLCIAVLLFRRLTTGASADGCSYEQIEQVDFCSVMILRCVRCGSTKTVWKPISDDVPGSAWLSGGGR